MALANAGLPELETCLWEVPRQAEHGDYASNVAMTLARAARRPPRQIAELIVKHFPSLREVERVDVAGPGFLNVFLSPAWCTGALGEILEAGDAYGRGESERGRRVRLEFVSANPTGPLVIVSARAAAIGDSLARLLRAQGAQVTTEYYVNDAGTQFEALARSLEARVRQALGMPAELPVNSYPGEYLADLASEYLEEQRARGAEALEALEALVTEADERERLERFGRYAVSRIVEQQRRVLLVTLLRDGQPGRMSKRRGEFVLMEELLEEVGRDAVRFTFLTRRHDSPLPFDLALATRQSAENPVYYVQYAHARIKSIDKQVAEQGIVVPPLGEVDLSPLRAGEELAIIKRLVQYPEVVKGAAHALEPHRLAYWLQELAGGFHPYYKTHRVIQDDRRLMHARLALCAGVGRVIRNGLELLGVSAPESM